MTAQLALTIAVIIVATWLLRSRRRKSASVLSRWQIRYSPGMPKAPTAQIYSQQTAKTYYAI